MEMNPEKYSSTSSTVSSFFDGLIVKRPINAGWIRFKPGGGYSVPTLLSLILCSLLSFTGIVSAEQHYKGKSWPENYKPPGYKYKGQHTKNYSWPEHFKGKSWPPYARHEKGKSWPEHYKPKGYNYKGKHAKGYFWPEQHRGKAWPKDYQHEKGKSWPKY